MMSFAKLINSNLSQAARDPNISGTIISAININAMTDMSKALSTIQSQIRSASRSDIVVLIIKQ